MLLLLVGCLTPPPATPPPTPLPARELAIKHKIAPFPVKGTDDASLRAATDALTGAVIAVDQWHGKTTWRIEWDFGKFPVGSDQCIVEDLQVSLTVVELYPTWDPPPGTDPDVVARWAPYFRDIAIHEHEHERIARVGAEEAHAALAGVGQLPCEGFQRAVDAVGLAVVEVVKQRQDQFDEETQSGRRPGG